jgi:hypothetical protein
VGHGRDRRGPRLLFRALGLALLLLLLAVLGGFLAAKLRGAHSKPVLHRAARPEYIRCVLGRLDARVLVGMRVRRAEDYAHGPGCVVRVLVVDGRGIAHTSEGLSNRVNVASEDGVVVRILTFG